MTHRDVAKFGIALGSGPRGPGFKSQHSDHKKAPLLSGAFFMGRKSGIATGPLGGSPDRGTQVWGGGAAAKGTSILTGGKMGGSEACGDEGPGFKSQHSNCTERYKATIWF